MTDRVVSHYRVLELLGEGGMGAVYKAEDTRLKRTVALKFLSKGVTGTGEGAERFMREAQAAAALDHPNICTVYEIDEADGAMFLAMAYLEGEALDERILRGPLPLDFVYELGKQAAEGLAAAHAAGVVHRDIKSSNVMLGEDRKGRPVVTLMDFGLAQVAGASKLTKVDTRMGTAAYMSPEQTVGDEVGPASDLWSLGVVLYEAATGELPFKGHYDQAILYGILNEDPPPVTSLRSRVPMEFEWIVEKCLAKAPADRYQDARELVVDLEMLQRRSAAGKTSVQRIDRSGDSGVGPEAPPEAPPSPSPESGESPAAARPASGLNVGAWPRRRLVLVGGLVAAGLLAAFGLGAILSGGSSDPPQRLRRFTLRPDVSSQGAQTVGSVAISPDGRFIAFSTRGSDGSLWLQPLDRLDPILIEGVSGARKVFWSPDSRSIGFTTSRTLGKVALRGHAVTVLVEGAGLGFANAAWTADGQSIAFTPSDGGGAMVVSALGGAPRRLFAERGSRRPWLGSPSYIETSDGGQVLVYCERSVEGDGVVARRVSDEQLGDPVRLLDGCGPVYSKSGHLLFQPEAGSGALWAIGFSPDRLETVGEAFVVAQDASDPSVSDDGTLVYMDNPFVGEKRLTWVDRDGRVTGQIGRAQPWIFGPRLSPTGERVLASGGAGRELDLWVHEAARPVMNRLTFDGRADGGAVWGPDGRSVMFSPRGGSDLLLASVGSGSAAEVLVSGLGRAEPLDWSRDGRYILLQQRRLPTLDSRVRPDGAAVPKAPRQGGGAGSRPETAMAFLELVDGAWERREFLPYGPYVVDDAVFSPDSRFVAYESNESGDFEVYVKPFPEGDQRWQVTTAGGRLARWSGDGRELYFVRDDTLYAVAIDTRDGFQATEAAPLFARDSLLGMRRYSTYDVAQDGRFVVVGPAGEPRDPAVRVVLNWLEQFRTP